MAGSSLAASNFVDLSESAERAAGRGCGCRSRGARGAGGSRAQLLEFLLQRCVRGLRVGGTAGLHRLSHLREKLVDRILRAERILRTAGRSAAVNGNGVR